MDVKQIKELMAAMGRAGIDKIVWKGDDFEVQLERHPESHPHTVAHYAHPHATFMAPPFEQDFQRPLPAARGVEEAPQKPSDQPGSFVTSPMVGTYYSSPSPEDPAFIKVGDRIESDTVVCIIEAMKVMNEVKSGIAGTVAEILVSNGSPVEFATKIIRVV
jgi:acetyl-CoA carboxylase biotin carboxyl carrier protein